MGEAGPTSINGCTNIDGLPELFLGTVLKRLLEFAYTLAQNFPGQERCLFKLDLSQAFFLFSLRPQDAPYFGYHVDAAQRLVCIPLRVMQGSRGGFHTCGGLVRAIAEKVSSRRNDETPWLPNMPRNSPPAAPETGVTSLVRELRTCVVASRFTFLGALAALPDRVIRIINGFADVPIATVPFDPLYHFPSLVVEGAHKLLDYVDDLCGACLLSRHAMVYKLSMETAYSALRPCQSSESNYRSCPISQAKFPEAAGTRTKDMLGILVDIHALTVSVTPERATKTITRIDALLAGVNGNKELWSAKELETVVGIIGFIAGFRPRSGSHIKPLYNAIVNCEVVSSRAPTSSTKSLFHHVRVTDLERAHLQEWRTYLASNRPVPIKSIVSRTRTGIGASDAAGEAGTGAGGWFVIEGVVFVWRIPFPSAVTNSLTRVAGSGTITICDLEFLGFVINIMLWVHTRKQLGLLVDDQVLLSEGDNAAAVAWSRGKGPPSIAGLFLARRLDEFLLDNGCLAESQHLAGELNILADDLSRKLNLTAHQCETAALKSDAIQALGIHSASHLELDAGTSHLASDFLTRVALLPRLPPPSRPSISSLRMGFNKSGNFAIHPAALCVNLRPAAT